MGRQKKKRNVVYYISGSIMTGSLLLIIAYSWILKDHYPDLEQLNPVFWLESLVLLSFGISWMTKGQMIFKDENYRRGP